MPEGGRPASYRQPAGTTAANATRSFGRGIGRVATGTARLTARSGRYAAAKAHAYTHSGGAGESGLARVTELHATARLMYRKADQFLLNFLFGKDAGITAPITVMSEDTKTIRVVSGE